MTSEMIPASLSSSVQSLMDSIVTSLPTFEDRLHSKTSWRVYQQDIKHFVTWLAESGITDVQAVNKKTMHAYYAHLRNFRYGEKQKPYSNATINRMFTVARRLLGILTEEGTLQENPCTDLDIKPMAVSDETTHIALNDRQAQDMFALIDTSTRKGKRDYALVSLLLRTGLRRNEARMLNIGDIYMEQGHYVASIHHAKGDKSGRVKIPPDVWRDIEEYEKSIERKYKSLDAPLFISFRK
ncbi:MAG TPA: tyrosine-type recombinase/integrase, partial [Ktedonobacteraceae bacterium]